MKKATKMLALILVFSLMLGGTALGAEQGVTDDTITVGSVGVTSGPAAFIGIPYYEGMEAYFKTLNAEGGVEGREVELIQRDDEFDPAQARDHVETLIYDDEVFAIVGQLGTPGVVSAAGLVEEAGIPSVYFGSGAAEMAELGDNFFPVQPNYVNEGKLKAQYAVDYFDADSIAVLYQNDEVGNDGITGIREGLEEMGREDLLSDDAAISYGLDRTDFTAQIQQVMVEDPDLLIIFGLAETASLIIRGVEDFGLDMPMLTTYSNADASFLDTIEPAETAPNVIENLHVMAWLEVDEEGMEPLEEAMAEYYPDSMINAYTMAGWVAAETFVAGVRATEGELNWDNYLETMDTLHFTEGMAPEISFEPGVREGVTHMSVLQVFEENGHFDFEQVTDFKEFGDF